MAASHSLTLLIAGSESKFEQGLLPLYSNADYVCSCCVELCCLHMNGVCRIFVLLCNQVTDELNVESDRRVKLEEALRCARVCVRCGHPRVFVTGNCC